MTLVLRPRQLLPIALAACAAFLLFETRGHTLLYDEWSFFADYRGHGPEILLNPFGGNLELLPILAYKAVFEFIGPDPVALRLLLVALDVTCATLLFLLLRERVGGWIALAAAVMLMLLGAAADVVAATLGLAILSAVACGLSALFALERRDRWGDRIAAVLLTGALASNSAGIPFLVGAAVDVLWVRPESRRRRIWIVAVPAVLYLIWRLWSAHLDPLGPLATHPTEITLNNIGTLPGSVAESLAAACLTITGLFRAPGGGGPDFSSGIGPVLAVAAAVLAVVRIRLGPALDRRILVFVAMPLAYWVLIGLVVSDRLPTLSRYQYAGAIFLLLLIAELARGIAISRRATVAIAAGFALATLPNLINLHDTARFLRYNAQLDRAELAAVELAGSSTAPPSEDLLVEPIGGRFDAIFVGGIPEITTDAVIGMNRYLRAAADFGSAAYTREELLASPNGARKAADQELNAIYSPDFAPAQGRGGSAVPGPRCLPLVPSGVPAEVEVPPGGAALRVAPGPPVAASLRRFGDEYSIDLGSIPGGATSVLPIPRDPSPVPWRLRLTHSQRILGCNLKGSQ